MLTDAEKKLRNNLGYSWMKVLGSMFTSDEVKSVARAVNARRKLDKVNVLPSRENTFRAFRLTPFEDVKVVIIGSEPFSNPHFVDGLAYSCPDIFDAPDACKSIQKAILADIHNGETDLAFVDTNLQRWAEQGVLLLNECLTTEEGTEFAHQKLGWNLLTSQALRALYESDNPIVFMTWGMAAKQFFQTSIVHPEKEVPHIVLSAANPNEDQFLATNCFSSANLFLKENQFIEIEW